MKKFYTITLLFLAFFYVQGVQAQGNTCADPYIVSVLPFNLATTTAGSVADYNTPGNCSAAANTGEDFVFTFTPAAVMNINITISAISAPGGVGLYILDDCMDSGTANCIGMDEPTTGGPVLDQISLSAGTTYYIFISTNDFMGFNPNTDFTIDITELPSTAEDGGISDIMLAASSCNLGATEAVDVEITNYGTGPIGPFDVVFNVDNGTPVTETYAGTIQPGATDVYSFTGTADLSVAGPHEIIAYTLVTNDVITDNDSLIVISTHSSTVSSFPYNEDFEGGDGGWFTEGTSNSWQYGTPAGTLINSAASGSNAWVTNLTGDYNDGELSYLISPCFDFTSLAYPMIEFNILYEMNAFEATAIMEYTTDFGVTWTKLGGGEPTNPEWYNDGGGAEVAWSGQAPGDTWLPVWHSLDGLGGSSSVIFRIKFEGLITGFFEEEGLAVDDFSISEMPADDLGVVDITAPVSGCNLTSTESVTIVIVNYGAAPQTGFDVQYSADGGSTYVTETFTGTILSGDSATFTFATTADLSTPGTYDFVAQTLLGGDIDNTNDDFSTSVTFTAIITSFPYYEGFDAGNGGWFAYGDFSTWQLGMPAAPVINNASSGTDAWVTNLTGDFDGNEASYLESPCFDFSSLTQPQIGLSIWYETTGLLDGSELQVSLDGGLTWTAVPSGVGALNWSDEAMLGLWSGNSGMWLTAGTTAYYLAGEPSVKFRISFSAGISGTAEGVAIDDFVIQECSTTSPVADFDYVINGTSVSFTNLSTDATSYDWDFGQVLGTSTEVNPVHDYLITGVYDVTLYSYNDCGVDSITITVDLATGIKNIDGFSVEIFPNPAEGIVYLSLQSTDDNVLIEIINLQGQIVKAEVLSNNLSNEPINISSLAKGAYYLRLKTDRYTHTEKLLIK